MVIVKWERQRRAELKANYSMFTESDLIFGKRECDEPLRDHCKRTTIATQHKCILLENCCGPKDSTDPDGYYCGDSDEDEDEDQPNFLAARAQKATHFARRELGAPADQARFGKA